MNLEQESKAVSYFLRHAAKKEGWQVTKDGYVDVLELIKAMRSKKFHEFSLDTLEQIVREDEKNRYRFSEDRQKVRANQGHSFDVDLGLKPQIPPVTLYHGTAAKSVDSIYKTGLERKNRHHVHLTDDPTTASSVGMRHGSEVLLKIDTRPMVKDGVEFFLSDNGVWLTEYIDPKYLEKK